MSKDDHFPIVGFVWQAFLFSVRFLLTHPVYYIIIIISSGDKSPSRRGEPKRLHGQFTQHSLPVAVGGLHSLGDQSQKL